MLVTISPLILSIVWSECKNYLALRQNLWVNFGRFGSSGSAALDYYQGDFGDRYGKYK